MRAGRGTGAAAGLRVSLDTRPDRAGARRDAAPLTLRLDAFALESAPILRHVAG